MKKLIALPFCCLVLAGCGGSGLPAECDTLIKEYDKIISAESVPAMIKPQLEQARKTLIENIEKLNGDQKVQACKAANQGLEQMKAALPK